MATNNHQPLCCAISWGEENIAVCLAADMDADLADSSFFESLPSYPESMSDISGHSIPFSMVGPAENTASPARKESDQESTGV